LILLDTDVFSFLARKGDTRADAYRKHIENKTVAISFISAGELYHWVLRHGLGSPKARELELKLDSVFVIPFDIGICRGLR
jgi:predicted nucleic acid-binding protein